MEHHVKRALHHPQRRRFVEKLAAQHEVSVEHFLAVVANRKRFKLARMYRQRSRKRSLDKNQKARKRQHFAASRKFAYAGDGELHQLMRQAGMAPKDFVALAGEGMNTSTFSHWNGYPMYGWPVALLREHVWAKNMAEFLLSKGFDPAMFKPKPLPQRKDGRYPRTSAQFPRFNPPGFDAPEKGD